MNPVRHIGPICAGVLRGIKLASGVGLLLPAAKTTTKYAETATGRLLLPTKRGGALSLLRAQRVRRRRGACV